MYYDPETEEEYLETGDPEVPEVEEQAPPAPRLLPPAAPRTAIVRASAASPAAVEPAPQVVRGQATSLPTPPAAKEESHTGWYLLGGTVLGGALGFIGGYLFGKR